MNRKKKIRKIIDNVAYNLSMEGTSTFVLPQAIILIILGKESNEIVGASLKDALITSFKIKPYVFQVSIQESSNLTELDEKIVQNIARLDEQGRSYGSLKIVFIGLMDDEIFNDGDKLAFQIREAFIKLDIYKIECKTSFYGIFRQSKMREINYTSAFSFVRNGRDIWKNIYHIEQKIVEKDMQKYIPLMAINILRNNSNLEQTDKEKEYRWKSIGMDSLRIPEMILTRVLKTIYSQQINNNRMDSIDYERNVRREVERELEKLYNCSENQGEQYVPLCYYDEEKEIETSWFDKWRKKGKVQIEERKYEKIFKGTNPYRYLLEELYNEDKMNSQAIEKVLCDIVKSTNMIGDGLSEKLEKIFKGMKEECDRIQREFDDTRPVNISKSDVTDYIMQEFSKEEEHFIIERKKVLLVELVKVLNGNRVLPKIVADIVSEKEEYMRILDELSINEYGGTAMEIQLADIPMFRIEKSETEILEEVGQFQLSSILRDNELVLKQLESFLGRRTSVIEKKHNLGGRYREYNVLEPIKITLLVNQIFNEFNEIEGLVERIAPAVEIKAESMIQKNTFYLISEREYPSDKCINLNYQRE